MILTQKHTTTINNFTDLKVWKEGHSLVLKIYSITKNFPREERYGIIDQLRRCSVSITSNVAEGYGRKSYKERVQFFYLSQGSINELKNLMLIARDLLYISPEKYNEIYFQCLLVHKLLQGLITKTKTFI